MKTNCKKIVLLSILCCLMVIGGLTSGKKASAQSGVYLPSTSKTFGPAKASSSFTVSGSGTWNAVSTCSWIRLTNSSGNGYGTVKFDMLENTSTTSSRSGQILVTCSTGVVGFYTVTQTKFVEQLTISTSSVTVPYGSINSKGGYESASGSMTFISNCNWTATCSSWIHLAATSGTRADSGKNLTFTADTNTTATSRSGFIKITTSTGIMKTCTVTQEKTQYIEMITEANGAVPDSCSKIHLKFYTSKKWFISKDGDFVSFSQMSGGPGAYVSVDQESGESGYAYVTATLEPNDTKEDRMSLIYIYAANQVYVIYINQAG